VSGYRLPVGGRIDRAKPVGFSFNGKSYSGFAGDTLASALVANGVDIIGRSFKYHRPRGIIAAGLDEPNAIVQVGKGSLSTPNLKATGVELYEGLKARSVNAWPSAEFDIMAINSLFGRFLPAGFYYKTFMWPDWHWYEPWIRKAAGLGKSPELPDTDIYDKRFTECDVLVVGGGPAGLMSALTAARSGARTIVVENESEWGGSLLAKRFGVDGERGAKWIDGVIAELTSFENATLLSRTMAFGYYDHNLIGMVERCTDHLPVDRRNGPRQRMWKVRAKRVVLASGAFERPLVFPNNDRPGVMLASAGMTYANRYGAAPGKRVLIATNNDSGYECASSLRMAGVDVVAIADARIHPAGPAVDNALAAGLALLPGMSVTNIRGARRVREAELHALDESGNAAPGKRHIVECDCVLTSGGWSPAVHLFSQSGGKLTFDENLQAFVPLSSVQKQISVGAAAGVLNLDRALQDAADECVNLVESLGFSGAAPDAPSLNSNNFGEIRPLWNIGVSTLKRPGAKSWLDFQNDVTSSDVTLALRENFKSVEHVKRYTTLGMASDQGKTSNVNGIGVMHGVLAKPIFAVGTTKFRPPFDPVTIGAFAGRRVGNNLAPLRPLAAETRHKALGAKMEDYGGWRRPAFFAQAGETEEAAVTREVKGVRNSVGLFEASPLGKIEVFGPDAGEFLNRIYVNNIKTLKPGRCRYGLMLNENGVIFDDGVLACLAENHYLVGTTSGHAAAIAETLQEWLQCEWSDLDVVTDDVTTGWAVMNVNGPRARDVLQKFDINIDLKPDKFPHMHVRVGKLESVPCRVQRVSFSGELSYEVAVPWGFGASFFDALMDAGKEFDIRPFGVEALMALRIEKGFLHVGSDTDGMTLPQDVGFGAVIEKKKDDFVGRRSTMRPDATRDNRRQFVGIEVTDNSGALPVGGHVIAIGADAPAPTQGWVSSSVYSPTLNKPVALGLVERGRDRIGEEIEIWDLGAARRARIVEPGAYDKEGGRLHV